MDDVPLPHTRMTAWPHGWHYTYTEDQLRAYGAACAAAERARVIEECAKVCDTTPPYPFRPSIEAAHAIRALAEKGEQT